jgi:hypothetical protein
VRAVAVLMTSSSLLACTTGKSAGLAPHYPNNGRPSIDPELMIRMLIIRSLKQSPSEYADVA